MFAGDWVGVLGVLEKEGQCHRETKVPKPYQTVLLCLLSYWGTAHSRGVELAGGVLLRGEAEAMATWLFRV